MKEFRQLIFSFYKKMLCLWKWLKNPTKYCKRIGEPSREVETVHEGLPSEGKPFKTGIATPQAHVESVASCSLSPGEV